MAEEIAPKIKKASVFFFDRLSAGALELARSAANAGALVMFEPCSVGNPVLFRQAWEIAHIVKYSHERLSELPEMDVESSPRLVIETLGDAGLRYQRTTNNRVGNWTEVKAFPVTDGKDTAGAGDWCAAGLLSKVAANGLAGFTAMSDASLFEAIRFGQALAAWNCKFEGARGGMYAVTKRQFQTQIREIMSGASTVIPATRLISTDPAASIRFCRECDHSVANKKKRTKSTG